MSALRKSETCEGKLRRMCKNIAEEITAGKEIKTKEGDDVTVSQWMEGTYDIRYYINRDKSYLGAEIMVAGTSLAFMVLNSCKGKEKNKK